MRITSIPRTIAHPTVFSIYEPIEHYMDSHIPTLGNSESPRVCPGALDFFLLHKLLTHYPLRPRVVDMAADATCGASTLFFATEPYVRDICVLRSRANADARPDWLPLFQDALSDLDLPEAPSWSIVAAERVADGLAALEKNGLYLPMLVFLAADDLAAEGRLDATLDELFQFQNDVVVAVFPLGRIGESAVLETLITHCAARKSRRLMALREVCPFTAASQIGLVYHSSNSAMDDILGQLASLFEGNFQFLSLTRELTTSHIEFERERERLRDERERLRDERERLRDELESLRGVLDGIRRSRMWCVAQQMRRRMRRLVPCGSWRERCALRILRAARWTKRMLCCN